MTDVQSTASLLASKPRSWLLIHSGISGHRLARQHNHMIPKKSERALKQVGLAANNLPQGCGHMLANLES